LEEDKHDVKSRQEQEAKDKRLNERNNAKVLIAMAWWMLLIYPVIIEMLIGTTRCYSSATVEPAKDAKNKSDLVTRDVNRMMAVPDIICGMGDGYNTYSFFMFFNILFICIYMIVLPIVVYKYLSDNSKFLSIDLSTRKVPMSLKNTEGYGNRVMATEFESLVIERQKEVMKVKRSWMGILMIGYKVFKEVKTREELKQEDEHHSTEEAETNIDKLNTE
jgi:hypothetical protein